MGTPLRVLIIEDSEIDALMLVLELKQGGYEPVHERVETTEAVRRALRDKAWDIILCDYYLSGSTAFRSSRREGNGERYPVHPYLRRDRRGGGRRGDEGRRP